MPGGGGKRCKAMSMSAVEEREIKGYVYMEEKESGHGMLWQNI